MVKFFFVIMMLAMPGTVPVAVNLLLPFMWAALFLLFLKMNVPKNAFKSVAFLLILFPVGFLGTLYGNDFTQVMVDTVYFGKVICCVVSGYLAARLINNYVQISKIIIYAGVVCSIIHLINSFVHIGLFLHSPFQFRTVVGKGFVLIVVAFCLVLFNRKNLGISKQNAILLIGLFMMSFFFAASRVQLGVLLLILLAVKGYILRISFRLCVAVAVIALSLYTIKMLTPESEMMAGKDLTFSGKIARSLDEIMLKDYDNKEDINSNWRGYEGYRGLLTYLGGNNFQLVFGRGFGSFIDLGITMDLGGESYSEVPKTHNGMIGLLVKVGPFGLLLYMIYFLYLGRLGKKFFASDSYDFRMTSRMLFGLCLAHVFTVLVEQGVFDRSDLVGLLYIIGIFVWKIDYLKSVTKS